MKDFSTLMSNLSDISPFPTGIDPFVTCQISSTGYRWINAAVVAFFLLSALLTYLHYIWRRRRSERMMEEFAAMRGLTHNFRELLRSLDAPLRALRKEVNLSAEGERCLSNLADEARSLREAADRMLGDTITVPEEEFVMVAREDPDRPETSVADELNAEFMERATECVMANITNESFGKVEFASAMMISQSLLYKRIKQLSGMSVVEFIRSRRLSHARSLLQQGRYNVTEVSEMCGFSSSAYFSRVYKESFGQSPSEIIPKTRV